MHHVFERPGKPGGNKNPIIGYAMHKANARYAEWHGGWSLDGKLVARGLYRDSANPPEEIFNKLAQAKDAATIAGHAKELRKNPDFLPHKVSSFHPFIVRK